MEQGRDPRAVANEFIQHGITEGNPITPMEVQKLMFFAHGWMLGLHNRPLHYDEWEAWRYGPVLPVIYHNLSYYGGNPVTETILAFDEKFDDAEKALMADVYKKYRPLGGPRLSRLTHRPGSPWHEVVSQRGRNVVIPNDLIAKHFRKMARRIEAMNG